MKLALATLAAVLLLAGCGQAKDPFVGTWRTTKGELYFVISKHGAGYLVLAKTDPNFRGVGVLAGHGDALTVSFADGAGPPARIDKIRLTVSPHDRLQTVDERAPGQAPGVVCFLLDYLYPATLVKVSNSTTASTSP